MKGLAALVSGVLALGTLTFSADATVITIEPDDYAAGTNLSTISPYAQITTTGGEAVYSASVHSRWERAAMDAPTQLLGDRVFSRRADFNSEWYYWDGEPDQLDGFEINFSQAISSFSLLFAELFWDGGCCFNDPIKIFMFDGDNQLIDALWVDEYATPVYLDDVLFEFPYYQFSYHNSDVRRVVVGGESEPTTIDRLSFELLQEVPVAPSLLLGIGLIGLPLLRRYRQGR